MSDGFCVGGVCAPASVWAGVMKTEELWKKQVEEEEEGDKKKGGEESQTGTGPGEIARRFQLRMELEERKLSEELPGAAPPPRGEK